MARIFCLFTFLFSFTCLCYAGPAECPRGKTVFQLIERTGSCPARVVMDTPASYIVGFPSLGVPLVSMIGFSGMASKLFDSSSPFSTSIYDLGATNSPRKDLAFAWAPSCNGLYVEISAAGNVPATPLMQDDDQRARNSKCIYAR